MSKSAPEVSSPAQPWLRTPWLRLLLFVLLLLALLWLLQLQASDYLKTLLAVLFIQAALAVSLTFSNGLSGLFSLGHPAFMTLGAYFSAILTFPAARKPFMLPGLPDFMATVQLPLLPAVLLAALTVLLAAFLVGLPVLRLRGHYLAVATLGLIVIVQGLALNLSGITRGGAGLAGVPRLAGMGWAFGFLLLTCLVCWKIKFSALGRDMLALRENHLAAECTGINSLSVRLSAFLLGALFAAIGGALMVHLIGIVTPRSYSIVLAFNLVAMSVIGGSGSICGALMAAFAVTLLGEGLKPLEESSNLYGLSQVIVALCLILVLYFRPQGLLGSSEPRFVLRFFNGGRSS